MFVAEPTNQVKMSRRGYKQNSWHTGEISRCRGETFSEQAITHRLVYAAWIGSGI